MKRFIWIYNSHFFLILSILLISCEEKRVPVLTTLEISDIISTTAFSGGNITDYGSSGILSCGVCWSETGEPTLSDNFTTENISGIGSFKSLLTGLIPQTNYFIRAYATNSVGTGYGNTLMFAINYDLFPINNGNEFSFTYYYYNAINLSYGPFKTLKGSSNWTVLSDSISDSIHKYFIKEEFNGIEINTVTSPTRKTDTVNIANKIRSFEVIEDQDHNITFKNIISKVCSINSPWIVQFQRYQNVPEIEINNSNALLIIHFYFKADSGLTKYNFVKGPNSCITNEIYKLNNIKIVY